MSVYDQQKAAKERRTAKRKKMENLVSKIEKKYEEGKLRRCGTCGILCSVGKDGKLTQHHPYGSTPCEGK